MSKAVKNSGVAGTNQALLASNHRTDRTWSIRTLRMQLIVGLITLGAVAGTALGALHESGSRSAARSHLMGKCFEGWPPSAD